MHPEIFHIGKFVIHSYGLMLALSFLFGIWFASRRARKRGLDPTVISDIGFWVILSAIVGARLYFVFLHFEDFKDDLGGIVNPFNEGAFGIGGLVMFGGLIGAIIAGLIFFNLKKARKIVVKTVSAQSPAAKAGILAHDSLLLADGHRLQNLAHLEKIILAVKPDAKLTLDVQRGDAFITLAIIPETTDSANSSLEKLGISAEVIEEKLPFLKYADVIAPAVGFGIFLTRIGCFLNGCCYGKPTESIWGVHFPPNSPAGSYQIHMHATQLYPSQLFDAFGGLLIALIVLLSERKKTFDGLQFFLTIMLYAVLRFAVDYSRYYGKGEVFASLSHNQFVCITIFIIFAGLIAKNLIFKQDSPELKD